MTAQNNTTKKRVMVGYHSLSPELQAELKKQYPLGISDSMLRIDRGPGDFFYAVILETEEANYLVKVDVKIDGRPEEEEDKDYYEDDIKSVDDVADDSNTDDE